MKDPKDITINGKQLSDILEAHNFGNRATHKYFEIGEPMKKQTEPQAPSRVARMNAPWNTR